MANFRIVAYASQQSVGHARRAPASARNFCCAFGIDGDAEQSGRTAHDRDQLLRGVELELIDDAKAGTQRVG